MTFVKWVTRSWLLPFFSWLPVLFVEAARVDAVAELKIMQYNIAGGVRIRHRLDRAM